MRRVLIAISLLCLLPPASFAGTTTNAPASTQSRVVKVLPQFLDLKGRSALSPSLYDRDAYQARLRTHPAERSGIRFHVQWRAYLAHDTNLTIRVEMRSDARDKKPQNKTLETQIESRKKSGWTSVDFTGEEYKKFGEVTAWCVTLWKGDQRIGQQKSFLW